MSPSGLTRCLLALVLAVSVACTRTYEAPTGKLAPGAVVVLGIDGLDRHLLDELAREGALPALSRVMREGVVADVEVGQPILSPRIWTTYASGYPAKVHGIRDWVDRDGRPLRATDVRVERVWDAAGEAGKTVLVSGWLMTTPVSPVNGVVLSDELVLRGSMDMDPALEPMRDPNVKDGWLAHPAERLAQVERLIPTEAWLQRHPLSYQVDQSGLLRHPLQRDETQVRSVEVLGPELKADLVVAYLSGADQLSHLYWPFVDPAGVALMQRDPSAWQRSAKQLRQQHPGRRVQPHSDGPVTQAVIDEGRRWVVDYYRYLDTVVARLHALVERSGGTLVICSDHGFQVTQRPVPLFPDHRDPAVLLAVGEKVRAGVTGAHSLRALDIAPTLYALLGVPAAKDMNGVVATELFEVSPRPTVPTRVRRVPSATPGAPSDHPRRNQLEALGYIDAEGRAIPRGPAPPR